ncbi:unnamed protein product [Diatraea saccharalis]|uniref:Uncharacterized protein n=1 Tax=Diatraea saccharalis TaxID=40085 RepID=A0A9N9W9D1_9NEOP|nr:unnamed protein product [Diatraea saccharalis]
MSGYLWGIGQLVNDPSAHLIDAIQKHILKKQTTVCNASTTNNSHGKPLNIIQSSTNISNINKDSGCRLSDSCSRKVCDKETRTTSTQVGNSSVKRRHVSTQCQGLTKKHSQTTSTRHIDYLDCSTVISNANVKKESEVKEAQTNTMNLRVCRRHRQAFKVLSNCSAISELQSNKSTQLDILKKLKNRISNVFSFLSLDKIENIPRYKSEEQYFFKLYKTLSCENIRKVSRKPSNNCD